MVLFSVISASLNYDKHCITKEHSAKEYCNNDTVNSIIAFSSLGIIDSHVLVLLLMVKFLSIRHNILQLSDKTLDASHKSMRRLLILCSAVSIVIILTSYIFSMYMDIYTLYAISNDIKTDMSNIEMSYLIYICLLAPVVTFVIYLVMAYIYSKIHPSIVKKIR
jgi:hypothetical protein